MPFDVGCGSFAQLPGAIARQRVGHRQGVGVEHLDPGGVEHAKGLGATMPGNQRFGSRLDDGLCRLDAGPLCCIEILLVADDLKGLRRQVIDEKTPGTPETWVLRRIEILARGGEGQFHVSLSGLEIVR